MGHLVHKDLAAASRDVAKCVDDYGQAVENVLIKYGKSIVNEQFILNRLANAAIDIYASAVVLSRATKSLNEERKTAQVEKLMAEAWVLEVCIQDYSFYKILFFKILQF